MNDGKLECTECHERVMVGYKVDRFVCGDCLERRTPLKRRIAQLEHENAQLEAWKKLVIGEAVRIAERDAPPMLVVKDPGRLPEDFTENMYVPIETYTEMRNLAGNAVGIIKALTSEVQAITREALGRIEVYEGALRNISNACQTGTVQTSVGSSTRDTFNRIARYVSDALLRRR